MIEQIKILEIFIGPALYQPVQTGGNTELKVSPSNLNKIFFFFGLLVAPAGSSSRAPSGVSYEGCLQPQLAGIDQGPLCMSDSPKTEHP